MFVFARDRLKTKTTNLLNGEIQQIVNVPIGTLSQTYDSYICKATIKYKVSYINACRRIRCC